MRNIWLYALPLVLAACHPMSASAAGRGQESGAAATAAGDSDYGSGTYVYADIFKPHGRVRSNAVREAAARLCDGGIAQAIGLTPFNACMKAHGWRFVQFQPAPEEESASSEVDNSPPSSSDNSGPDPSLAAIEASNAQAALDASTAAAQQQFNDAMAAAQQTMNNANFSQQ
jgi:hypothetical protein